MMKNPLLFAIVTYKEKYFECLAFRSLVRSFGIHGEGKLNIFIFDNTDLDHWNVEKNEIADVNINYVHQNDNPGISFAYNRINDFAVENQFEWIVFFDQDTELPEESYKVYSNATVANNEDLQLKIPVIYSENLIMSPSIYKNFRSYRLKKGLKPMMQLNKISCINSGLMIQSLFFSEVGGYNERLKLDFCDHDFIEKVKRYLNKVGILDLKLSQNFSSVEHNKKQAIERYKIFCKDLKEFYKDRSNSTVFFYVDLPHMLKLISQHKTLAFLSIRLNELKK